MSQLETPVVLLVFNRPEPTRDVFAAVAAARPTRLFLVADGPRANRPGEAELCEEVRRIVTAVDWPCQVETNFAPENMGLRKRVSSGLNWVFSLAEDAIILEDDCVPDPSFFTFCAAMLERHRHDEQVALVSGFNPLEAQFPFPFSYYYALPMSFSIWGWATWRRAWKQYDEPLTGWPEVRDAGLLRVLFPDEQVVAYWALRFEDIYTGRWPNSWAYRWIYTCWTRNWLTVVPGVNMVQNIGFGADATHTTGPDPDRDLPAQSMKFPLKHPPAITAWPDYEMKAQRRFYTPNLLWRMRRRLLMKLRFKTA